MHFSVIYSVDCPRAESIKAFAPPAQQRRLWERTEGDSGYEYGYLEGRWTEGKHRKWCAVLDREQFQAFLDETGMHAENVRTMGSLGAPGCGLGLVPAFSFTDDFDRDAIVTAVQEKTGMSNAAATNADPSARLG